MTPYGTAEYTPLEIELLATLREIQRNLYHFVDNDPGELSRIVGAAIAKAEGYHGRDNSHGHVSK